MEKELVLHSKTLPMLSTISNGEMSIYSGDLLDQTGWAEIVKKLKVAYPKHEKAWYELLRERLKEKKFTNKRAIDAVNNCIDTVSFYEAVMPKILSFDYKIEMLTYEEVERKNKDYSNPFMYYEAIDVEGLCYYTRKENVKKYDLKRFVPKNYPQKEVVINDGESQQVANFFKDILKNYDLKEK